jgi:hypothetical protein
LIKTNFLRIFINFLSDTFPNAISSVFPPISAAEVAAVTIGFLMGVVEVRSTSTEQMIPLATILA